MIDHCVTTIKRIKKEKSFRVYVTDALQVLTENTTNHVSINGAVEVGKKLVLRWIDAIEQKPKEEEKEDDRSCEEITKDIFARAGIR